MQDTGAGLYGGEDGGIRSPLAPYGLDMPESAPIAFPVDQRKQAAFVYALYAPVWAHKSLAQRIRKARAIAQ